MECDDKTNLNWHFIKERNDAIESGGMDGQRSQL